VLQFTAAGSAATAASTATTTTATATAASGTAKATASRAAKATTTAAWATGTTTTAHYSGYRGFVTNQAAHGEQRIQARLLAVADFLIQSFERCCATRSFLRHFGTKIGEQGRQLCIGHAAVTQRLLDSLCLFPQWLRRFFLHSGKIDNGILQPGLSEAGVGQHSANAFGARLLHLHPSLLHPLLTLLRVHVAEIG
jgi:hypothetical protein